MSDHAEIVELVVRFADAVNRLDVEQFEHVWAPEGHWIIDPPTDFELQLPRAEIATIFGDAMTANWASFLQLVHGTVVDIHGDHAHARSYLTEIAVPREGDFGYRNHGQYLDDLVRTDEGWRFARRHYRYLLHDDAPITGNTAPLGGVL
ncbi:unannotated protein [freshwater metagenome]|uniref:Unannotated protein n=1 Tax=freshwater metagenome TaxID=449393 RepID=A0A6J7I9K6_9ZZZZ|nr:hypothetical protein [Actinomycetota bacterium]